MAKEKTASAEPVESKPVESAKAPKAPKAEAKAEAKTGPVGPKSYLTAKDYPPLVQAAWDQKRDVPTKRFKVTLFGGRAEFESETFNAVDESEAISFFVVKNGVRDPASYRRRVELVTDGD